MKAKSVAIFCWAWVGLQTLISFGFDYGIGVYYYPFLWIIGILAWFIGFFSVVSIDAEEEGTLKNLSDIERRIKVLEDAKL